MSEKVEKKMWKGEKHLFLRMVHETSGFEGKQKYESRRVNMKKSEEKTKKSERSKREKREREMKSKGLKEEFVMVWRERESRWWRENIEEEKEKKELMKSVNDESDPIFL